MNSPTPNTITADDVMAMASKLGAEAALGRDTQIKSLLKCLEGAYHGVLDLKKNKHGTDFDDATKYAEAYFKARNQNAIFDAKADNQQKLASTIRTAIKLGATPKLGNGEPIASVNNLMTHWQKAKQGADRKRLDDAANVFLRYARIQLKRDTVLDDAELKELIFKKSKEDQTVEDILDAMNKKLGKLIDGSANGGQLQCNTAHIKAARHSISQELAAIAKGKAKAGV